MKRREVLRAVKGQNAVDGAGVKLVRVLGNRDTKDFDPFLMLDSFDSIDPADYLAGFPTHPHRGIETITYLIEGKIEHEDSLGNRGSIEAGQSQWMTAGSGILHQEMPKKSERMLGFQLWLNLPRADKMTQPKYLSIEDDMMGVTKDGQAEVRVISGQYGDTKGVTPHHIHASIYEVTVQRGGSIEMTTAIDETVFVFFIKGGGIINDQAFAEKTAVLFEKGDYIHVKASEENELCFIYFSGKPLHEPIAWGGPIVMNTQSELKHAFEELQNGTFIKHD